jgi:hypothetical protein
MKSGIVYQQQIFTIVLGRPAAKRRDGAAWSEGLLLLAVLEVGDGEDVEDDSVTDAAPPATFFEWSVA